MPFGYGPASKAIALARRLREEWRLVFAGRGSALELVARTPDLFDEVLEGSAADPVCAARMARAWGVVSVMDRDAGDAAERLGKPLFVVDSLAWMRAASPASFVGARVYWAQRFPGVRVEGLVPRPSLIGPILAERVGGSLPRDGGLVIHLGGSAAPRGREGLYAAYARFVTKAVLEAGLGDRFREISVLGGAAAIAALEAPVRSGLSCIESLAPEDARDRLARAEAVLTAPGLTTTIECFQDGTPTWFLPPQNYSQWCILRHLRAAGVADGALHWEDLPEVPKLADRMAAEVRDPIVCTQIERLLSSSTARSRLRSQLAEVGEGSEVRVARQAGFSASLGPLGIEEIASTLRRIAATERRDMVVAGASG
jgi:hypothetical protein